VNTGGVPDFPGFPKLYNTQICKFYGSAEKTLIAITWKFQMNDEIKKLKQENTKLTNQISILKDEISKLRGKIEKKSLVSDLEKVQFDRHKLKLERRIFRLERVIEELQKNKGTTAAELMSSVVKNFEKMKK